MQLSRIRLDVWLVSTPSAFQDRLSGGTDVFDALSDGVAAAGDAAPFAPGRGDPLARWLVDGDPVAFCLFTSFRHLETISLDSRATSGDLCCLNLLTTIPTRVDRSRSSDAFTPCCNSLSNDTMVDEDSFCVAALVKALVFSSISLASIVTDCLPVRLATAYVIWRRTLTRKSSLSILLASP